jgi:hypothetical protein
MQHDPVEIADREEPVTAHSRVTRRDGLERAAAEIACADDVDDVLRRRGAHRRDRVDDRNGPLQRQLVENADLLRKLAVQRVNQALARVDAAAGKKPVLLLALWGAKISVLPANRNFSGRAPNFGTPQDSNRRLAACDPCAAGNSGD